MWRILKFLPRKWLSRITGFLVHLRGPKAWNEFLITTFAGFYRINIAEAEKPISEYPSLGEFFVRRLKPGARPLSTAPVVHCADAQILQAGPIEEGMCLQAKGKNYSIKYLLVDEEWREKFEQGSFVTYYLCPTDYHRVHSPVEGFIRSVTYVPGDLWPVHKSAVGSIDDLYLVNERVVVEMATDKGAVAVVFVGATNVGSIALNFDSSILGNRGKAFTQKTYSPPLVIHKGQELGMFRMGSTVVVLFSKGFGPAPTEALLREPFVKVNAALAKI